MSLHSSTFGFLNPTPEQKLAMEIVRSASSGYCSVLEQVLPDGPDKTYALRKVREVCMWGLVTITRMPDGTPRDPDTIA